MIKKQKGGIETIIAVVVLVGLVVALILGTVIPMAAEGGDLTKNATDKLSGLDEKIKPSTGP